MLYQHGNFGIWNTIKPLPQWAKERAAGSKYESDQSSTRSTRRTLRNGDLRRER
jgi:hypothetical protein